jgi:hypothetical protein
MGYGWALHGGTWKIEAWGRYSSQNFTCFGGRYVLGT